MTIPGSDVPDVRELLAEIRGATTAARAVAVEQAAERAELARVNAREDERRARAARTGELGPDWQELQRQMDVGQTSIARIFSGQDSSTAACAVLDHAMDRMVELSDEFATHVESSRTAGTPDPALAALDDAVNQVRAIRARLAERNDT